MVNFNRNTLKTWKIVDQEGNVIKYFRTFQTARNMFKYYQHTYIDKKLEIQKC